MQVAEILSDLTSLQVCVSDTSSRPRQDYLLICRNQDPSAALALVSARPESGSSGQKSSQNGTANGDDPDLKRAKDMLELHAIFKVAHPDASNPELNEARETVERVLRTVR